MLFIEMLIRKTVVSSLSSILDNRVLFGNSDVESCVENMKLMSQADLNIYNAIHAIDHYSANLNLFSVDPDIN